jgi:hypothetical protein
LGGRVDRKWCRNAGAPVDDPISPRRVTAQPFQGNVVDTVLHVTVIDDTVYRYADCSDPIG